MEIYVVESFLLGAHFIITFLVFNDFDGEGECVSLWY